MNYPHPMVEVALAHAKSAATTQGLSLVGLYLANERLDDKSINSHAASVIARVRKDVQPALVWFIHNDTLTSPPSRLSVTAFVSKNEAEVAKVEEPSAAALSFGTWNKDTVRLDALPAESGITAVGEALEALTQYGLVDFDDHLEHPELNYLVQPLPEIKERNQPRK
ncbi:hypothetical protein AGDE_02461 [Angomonas deanei]|nr:hypothetical protein AGDE_04714 [Angomonas deanei]EPY41463.1 hypothetical protein AGDE_02461 [Angomonas deanei]|eukprot:EPY39214.1 hypothetical protein AGDE_04714 [Angomonas deanei]